MVALVRVSYIVSKINNASVRHHHNISTLKILQRKSYTLDKTYIYIYTDR